MSRDAVRHVLSRGFLGKAMAILIDKGHNPKHHRSVDALTERTTLLTVGTSAQDEASSGVHDRAADLQLSCFSRRSAEPCSPSRMAQANGSG